MIDSAENQLATIVERAVGPVQASRSRKQMIREELLAHVVAVYDAELETLGDEQAALEATCRRFGVADELESQLQGSVPPLERWLLLPEREILMSRWFWLIAILAVFVGPGFVLPAVAKFREESVLQLLPLVFGGLITLAGLAGVGYGVARRFIRPAN
jgi:hypothetical protein